ncbi:MAG TPA: phage Gp37/Gp68 family protein [Pontiellaceae bacterium]|nr:phage Gp37/Gp68 family protein [Pontiellaceae bacterium]
MKKHKIGWLNVPGYIPQTWNPIVGCSKVSEGCRNCYAERMANRLARMMNFEYMTATGGGGGWNGETILCEPTLKKAFGWKKPHAIFGNSMGDLFHENTPDEWIDRVFAVMALCPQHLFIVLTKRAERMEKYFSEQWRSAYVEGMAQKIYNERTGEDPSMWLAVHFPLPNVWLGVTAENQAAADERIPHLLRTPAAVRFVSCEPLIGPVNVSLYLPFTTRGRGGAHRETGGLDWIICGGESGPGARPMNPEWARSLRDQAQAAGVPFFFKQWGRFAGGYRELPVTHSDVLDGQQLHQWPEVKK